LTDPDALKAELALVRKRGYAVDRGEHEQGLYCVGAPIYNASGKVFASCSTSEPREHMDDETIVEWARMVCEAADLISRRMGYVPATLSQVRVMIE